MKRMRIIAMAIILSGLFMAWVDSNDTYAAEPNHPAVSAHAHHAVASLK